MAKAQPVFCLKRADNGAAADFPLSRQQSARPLFAHTRPINYRNDNKKMTRDLAGPGMHR